LFRIGADHAAHVCHDAQGHNDHQDKFEQRAGHAPVYLHDERRLRGLVEQWARSA
jgi:hypothetical protein